MVAMVTLALAGGAAAQGTAPPARSPLGPPPATKGQPTVIVGPMHPNCTYSVVLPVWNKCSWQQDVTITKSGGNYAAPINLFRKVPPKVTKSLEVESGTAEKIRGMLDDPNVRIEFTHAEAPGVEKFCMARYVSFATRAWRDKDEATRGNVEWPLPTIVLEEVSQKDYDAGRYQDPKRATTVDMPLPKKPGAPSDQPVKKAALKKALPWVGGGVAAVAGVVALTGGGDTPPASSTPSLPLPPPPSGALFCGTYTGQLEPTQVACGFSTAFPMRFVLTCSSSGSAQLVISRADNDPQGQRFEYTGTVSPAGALDFSGGGNLRGLATYTGHFTGVITGNGTTLEGTNTVTFTEPGCQGQTLVQRITGTRAN